MKKRLFLFFGILLVVACNLENPAIAQDPIEVHVTLTGTPDKLGVKVEPWRIEMWQNQDRDVVWLLDNQTEATAVLTQVDNTGAKRSACRGLELPDVAQGPPVDGIRLGPFNVPTNPVGGRRWCSYNIVIELDGEAIKIDPDFRVEPGGPLSP